MPFPETLRLGVDYYPEHDPESEWDRDAALMQELGLDTIRIGEFCWSRMQQGDGTLTLDWLERVIETFDRRGIKTILCTPTATPPVWAVERFADLAPLTPDGRPGLFGGRRHYSAHHAGYRALCVDIATGLAQRFGQHPGVVAWYIDNEVGSYSTLDCSAPALAAFHRWLQARHGTVERLNRAWGLIFWNQEVERFDQVPAPTEMMCTRSPQMLLDFNRFSLEGLAEFIFVQAQAIRRFAPPRQVVMSSCVEQVAMTLHRLQERRGAAPVDTFSVNQYPELFSGAGAAAMHLDRQRGINSGVPSGVISGGASGGRFIVPELQIGSSYSTTNGIDPAVRRFWAWECLARGARTLCWFHWRRFRTGVEWRHPCIVERDRQKRSTFHSMQADIREIRAVAPLLLSARVEADVQVLYSLDNSIARDRASEALFWMQIQLPEGARHRFQLWERELRRAAYNPLGQLGLTVDFVTEEATWDPAKPLIATDLDICPPVLAAKLRAYCESGGTLICFPGAGERDEHGAQVEAPPPGTLAPLFGVELAEYYPIEERGAATFDPATGAMTDAEGDNPRHTSGQIEVEGRRITVDTRHAEVLNPRAAAVIGRYAGGPFDGQPAVTACRVGKGQAVYLGAVPQNAEEGCRFWPALLAAVKHPVFARMRSPAGLRRQRVVSLSTAQGPYQFLLNDAPEACSLPRPVQDALTGREMSELPAYGVALVRVGKSRE